MKLIGIVLVILGAVGLAYGGVTWTTKDKGVVLLVAAGGQKS
jgi:hypothetical protein